MSVGCVPLLACLSPGKNRQDGKLRCHICKYASGYTAAAHAQSLSILSEKDNIKVSVNQLDNIKHAYLHLKTYLDVEH